MTELYKRFPKLCTCWAFLEVVCFAGIVYGWGSLVFILKEEGFYLDACIDKSQEDTMTEDVGLVTNSSSPDVSYQSNITNGGKIVERLACDEQESRLNLWFSIAVSIMYLSFTAIGYIIRCLGTRTTRFIFL